MPPPCVPAIVCDVRSANAMLASCSFGSKRNREGLQRRHERLDIGVGEVVAERRHPGPPERRPSVLDDVEEVAVGTASRRARQITGANQEQGGSPRSVAV